MKKSGARLGASSNQGERCERGPCSRRRRSRGVDVAPRAVPDERDDRVGAGDERAHPAECFSERADQYVRDDFGRGAETAAIRSEDTESVGFVDEKAGAIRPCQVGKLAKRGCDTVHREERIGHDQGALRPSAMGLQQRLKVLGIAVPVDVDGCSREAAAIDQAGVIERVAEDRIAGSDQGLDRSHIGGVPVGEKRRRRCGDEIGEGPFGLFVGGHRPGD